MGYGECDLVNLDVLRIAVVGEHNADVDEGFGGVGFPQDESAGEREEGKEGTDLVRWRTIRGRWLRACGGSAR